MIKNMKIKNVYDNDTTFTNEDWQAATLKPEIAIMRSIPFKEFERESSRLVMSMDAVSKAESAGLLHELVACGTAFKEQWNCETGDFFMILHLAGDQIGEFTIVDKQDVWCKFNPETLEYNHDKHGPSAIKMMREAKAKQ